MNELSREPESKAVIGRLGLRTEPVVVVLDGNNWPGGAGYRALRILPLVGVKPIYYGFSAGAARRLGRLGKIGTKDQIQRVLSGDFIVAGKDSFFDEHYRHEEVANRFPEAEVTEEDRPLIDAAQGNHPYVRRMDDRFPRDVGERVAKAAMRNSSVWQQVLTANRDSGGTLRARERMVPGLSREEAIAYTSLHDAANILHVGAEFGAEAPLIPDLNFLPLFSIARDQSLLVGRKTLVATGHHSSFAGLPVRDQWDFLSYSIDLFQKCWYGKRFDVDRFRATGLELVSLNLLLGLLERAPRSMTEEEKDDWRRGSKSAFVQTAKRAKAYEKWAENSVQLARDPLPKALSMAQLAITTVLRVAGVPTPITSGPLLDQAAYNAMLIITSWHLGDISQYGVETMLGNVAAFELNLPLAARHIDFVPKKRFLDNAGNRLPLN